jgi:predicted GNAT superfamily acetyltransferase
MRKALERTVVVRNKRFLLRVETSHESEDYGKYEALRDEIWNFPGDHMSGTRNLMCENVFHEGGSLFIGAFVESPGGGFEADGDHLAGFCYGFVGVRDKEVGFRDPSNLRFYSQYAAVRKAYQSYGLGVRLKEFQKEMILDILGVSTVICTYDPLTGINAHRNVHHFGMDVLEYRVATYGEYGGLLNRLDVPTDRFLMSWDLERKPGRPDYDFEAALSAPQPIVVGLRDVKGKNSTLELEVAEKTDLNVPGDLLLVRIPRDFYRMLQETDVADRDVRRIAVDWRLASREVFRTLFTRGYRVIDFRIAKGQGPGHYYVLSRPAASRR